MIGGSINNGTRCYSDIWRIDLESLEWFKLDYTHKIRKYDHIVSVVDDSYLYSVGCWFAKKPLINTIERFTLRLPSLYRLSLESVCRSPNCKIYLKSLSSAIVDELNNKNSKTDARN
ncbi:hypothetical protein RF11_05933 [Thelohanellus kitauei]|uniref:Kelch domain-containing protein 10 n=1 Tax=Thelohanellus kitauei TaxID=669202 RepID=A0A0C2JRK9_THEKT|nr:hypothetical protein RF11_05933 [Thelohanellus kitauei]